MKKLGIVAAVLVGLAGTLLGVAAAQPDTYSLERSKVYDAPPAVVWAIVSD